MIWQHALITYSNLTNTPGKAVLLLYTYNPLCFKVQSMSGRSHLKQKSFKQAWTLLNSLKTLHAILEEHWKCICQESYWSNKVDVSYWSRNAHVLVGPPRLFSQNIPWRVNILYLLDEVFKIMNRDSCQWAWVFPSVPLKCLIQPKLLQLLNCQPIKWQKQYEQIKLRLMQATDKHQWRSWKRRRNK